MKKLFGWNRRVGIGLPPVLLLGGCGETQSVLDIVNASLALALAIVNVAS